jgi:hypothetical protein
MLAERVAYVVELALAAVPAVFAGATQVTVTPPAVYEPELATSPVAEYAVVVASTVADAKYNAALKTSAVFSVRAGVVAENA